MSLTPNSSPMIQLTGGMGVTSAPGTPTTPLATGVHQRLLLKQTAIDTWSLKEQLGLASAVLRSGDQNWVSVSRQMKPFSEDGRPPDWFSQKNCALQYNLLLGKTDTPRRKRGEKAVESVETPGEAIVKRLTTDRIKELRKLIEAETIELMQLEDECKILSDDNISDEKLKEIEISIELEEKAEAEQKAIHEKWLKEREEKKQAILAALKAHTSKLPLKGAAAAAVQQAGAARRASTQSERSSFSEVDSPSATLIPVVPSENTEPITPKKEVEIETHTDNQDANLDKNLPKSPENDTTDTALSIEPSPIKPISEIEDIPNKAITEPNSEVEDLKSKISEEISGKDMLDETTENKIKEEVDENIDDKSLIEEDTKEELSSVSNAASTEEKTEDEEDGEVIIKKDLSLDSPMDDSESKKTRCLVQRPYRNKKASEVSEEEEILDESKTKRETRNKKISERSDDTEESPAPPLRSTRRRGKVDDSSNEREETVENKRLSRVKETDTRGRRGSGTASRSSSPVGSDEPDESEADQTPTRGSRSRKKSGRTGGTAENTESAPPSPSVSGITETSEDSSTEEWKRSAFTIINDLKNHRLADRVFAVAQNENVKVILKDMDLSMIRKNMETGSIKSPVELHMALHQTFLNIVMSVCTESEEYDMALSMYRDCVSLLDDVRSLSLSIKSPSMKSLKNRDRKDSKRSGDDSVTSSSKRRKR